MSEHLPENNTPWRRVVARFGLTPAALATELGRHRSKITRAINDPEGLISGRDQKALQEVAARRGITLEASDLVA